ncbi:MAG TPA: hypothetical protein VFZ34_11065 [Blastocatellia bacterium]|nr:hypothetical protein [Blastocatellia bacterium]
MKINAVVLKYAVLALQIASLAALFFVHGGIVLWVEDAYPVENSDFVGIAIIGLTLIPMGLLAVLFHRPLKRRWTTSRISVIALGSVLFVWGLAYTWGFFTVSKFIKYGHESTVIASLEEIYRAQIGFKAETGRYATLQELVDKTFLHPSYLSEKKLPGYKLSESGIAADTFCIHADRVKDSMGNRDF